MQQALTIGVAGHVDHGKTSMVGALTGVQTDVLVEERRRGISIELGFAPLVLQSAQGPIEVGLIDMPGHEKFVRRMISGAAGLDAVLLVVAADEGVMPQGREHLAICE
ncbi:MAG: selenocysteine-specific translation elongation factor, partial [Myxococcales bacterium]|nr:selenocysteine-specific translation elongation factor [Myxococcales bacterium]